MTTPKTTKVPRRQKVSDELEAIYKAQGGLNPRYIEQWAAKRRKSSAIAAKLEWDNTKAGKLYRIQQIRELIVEVQVVYPDRKIRQTYVSVSTDRGREGYKMMVDVLSDDQRRELFLADALRDLDRLRAKYGDLEQLAGVWAALAAAAAPKAA